MLVSMLLSGWYFKVLDMRKGMTISGVMLVLSFSVFGLAKSYPVYCLASSLLGLSYGFGTIIPVAIIISRWFESKRDTALGICTAVTGFSTLGIPSLISKGIENLGLGTTFLIESACIAVMVAACSILLKNNPKDIGLEPYRTSEKNKETIIRGRGLNNKDWIVIFPVLIAVGATMNVAFSHLAILVTSDGYSADTAALAVAVSGIALMLGKLAYGRMADSFGSFKCNLIFGPVLILGLILLSLSKTNVVVMMAGMGVYGFALAYVAMGLSIWPVELSSPEKYATTVQFFNVGYAVGGLLTSAIPGILADRFGGSYIPAYWFFTICAVFILVLIQCVFSSKKRASS